VSGAVAATTTQQIYYFGAGVSPVPQQFMGVVLHEAAYVPQPFNVFTWGRTEYGGGLAQYLNAATGYTVFGPYVCTERHTMRVCVTVNGNMPFDLNYQFTPDGSSYFTGQQVAATLITTDGSGYTYQARIDIDLGYQYQIQVYNQGADQITFAWSYRLYANGALQ
jgi:hypothetical protein